MNIFSIVKKYRGSKEAKKVGANFLYLIILQFGGYVFPLITLPYLAHIIGVDGFGKIAFASAIVGYVQTVTDWGYNFTTTRDIAKNRDNMEAVAHIYSTVTCARVFLMIISIALIAICVGVVPYLRQNALVIFVSLILIPGHIMFPEWLFQGLEEMKYITYLNFMTKMLFTALIFIFIKQPEDFILQPLFLGLGTIVSGIIGIWFVWKKWHIKISIVPFKDIYKSIKSSADVFINTLMPNLYNSFSIILLGLWGGSMSNGYFDGGSRFNTIIAQFQQVLSRAFFPMLARRIDKHQLFSRLSVGISLFVSLVSFIFAPWIVHTFLTGAFDQSITVLRILSLSLVFLVISNVYGSNYLILIGKERQLRNATAVSSLVGFAMAFPLVYYFDYIGAAITISATRTILGISIYFTARREQRRAAAIQ